MAREPIPLRERRADWLFLGFFVLNATFITYVVDLEQLVIADTDAFDYPLWPPAPLVDLVHWYGRTFDPLLMARPPFWRMTIWIDVLFFGPFYVAAHLRVRPRPRLDPGAGAGLVRHDAGQRADHPDGGAVRRDADPALLDRRSRPTRPGC